MKTVGRSGGDITQKQIVKLIAYETQEGGNVQFPFSNCFNILLYSVNGTDTLEGSFI